MLPVDQGVELVKQPAESVPVTGATERYYQVQGRGQVAGAGLASGFGGAPQQRQGFAHSWPAETIDSNLARVRTYVVLD